MTVQVIDKGWDAIGNELKKLSGGKAASVGIQGSKASESHGKYTNVEIGAVHEYGTKDGRIPERSFIRSTYAENEATIVKEAAKIASTRVFEGKSPIADITMMGEDFRKKILEKIQSGIAPPLAESTIEHKKGEGTPLIDTGQLWNAISSEVVDPGKLR